MLLFLVLIHHLVHHLVCPVAGAEYKFPGQKEDKVADKEFPTADMIPDLQFNSSMLCGECVNVIKYEVCASKSCDETSEYRDCKDTCLVEGEEICESRVDGVCKPVVNFSGAIMPMCTSTTGEDDSNAETAICRNGAKRYRCFPDGTQVRTCYVKNCTLNFKCGCTGNDYNAFCDRGFPWIAVGPGGGIVLCCCFGCCICGGGGGFYWKKRKKRKKHKQGKQGYVKVTPEVTNLIF